ncbi:MAG: ABC transporter permease [Acutalibacteraceae bacterium]|nr:ABC transporter permease [Acutalibacteraceae bacterium]
MFEEIIVYPAKSLFRKKGRSILTILGVAIGVCSVIIISSIGTFGTTAVNNELDCLGMGGLTIATKKNNIDLSENELKAIRGASGVMSATPVYMENSEAISSFGKSENSIVWGIDDNAKDIVSLQLMYGREINKSDISENSSVCMVDQTFAQSMFGKDNAVGHKISLIIKGNTEIFTIIGVIKTGSGLLQSAMGNYVPNFVYIPYTTMQTLTGATNYSQIITKANPEVNLTSLATKLENTLTFLNGADPNSYTITNLAKQKESLTNILSIVTSILSAVGAVSLVVAGLSIMTVMLVSVGERKREIGIKKAIGATRFIIVREFLCEALTLSIIGCIVGILISFSLVTIGSKLLDVTISINLKTVSITCLFSVVMGAVFGAYPALIAAKLNPAETLRSL